MKDINAFFALHFIFPPSTFAVDENMAFHDGINLDKKSYQNLSPQAELQEENAQQKNNAKKAKKKARKPG